MNFFKKSQDLQMLMPLLFECGFSKKKVFKILKASELVDCSYVWFLKNLAAKFPEPKTLPTAVAAIPTASQTASAVAMVNDLAKTPEQPVVAVAVTSNNDDDPWKDIRDVPVPKKRLNFEKYLKANSRYKKLTEERMRQIEKMDKNERRKLNVWEQYEFAIFLLVNDEDHEVDFRALNTDKKYLIDSVG